MPHRRKPVKGSFGSHFDELVKQFPGERQLPSKEDDDHRSQDERSVHDRLFESAWRDGGEERPRPN